MATTGLDLLRIVFGALTAAEQDEAFAYLQEMRLQRLAGEESEAAKFLRAMQRVALAAGPEPTIDDYNAVRDKLRAEGEELPSLSATIKHFGSWRRAKEGLTLAGATTADKIHARFRSRRAGRFRNWQEAQLRDSLAACTKELNENRPPLVSEYLSWRQRELELADARGEKSFRVPSPAAFRARYGTWEKALQHFGYDASEIYRRFEPSPARADQIATVDRYTDETLRDVLLRCAHEVGNVPLVEEFDAWRTREINRTRRKKLMLPSNSPYRRRWGTWEGALLHFGFSKAEIDARRAPAREVAISNLRANQYRTISSPE